MGEGQHFPPIIYIIEKKILAFYLAHTYNALEIKG